MWINRARVDRVRVSHIGERGLRSGYRGTTTEIHTMAKHRHESLANVGVFFEIGRFQG